ncbi:FAD-dependent oxidoreductase [Persicimonas caeni]|uniref:FAD-dependent oxidoreductase n=1 Tax=Persicimonas caeni TaxID=2292766 RepID=A0A4Y6Q3B3_PERCE|nr:FAD-dependent monooxygenase [Persicimonas caeni]QDG54657.1 FAD-dependent oxidoreductase [Persicimonas caeni]QED35878.1 FAD-dependent oxidoreductase [Persicimonas caeni]
MRPSNVIIIGGGIGGLTLARALEQRNIEATVYEQAPALREVGAGIGLWSNAVSVLDSLGYAEAMVELGAAVDYGEFVAPSGEVLAHYAIADLLDGIELDAAPRIVHRGALLEMLAEGLESTSIVFGKGCVSVDADGARPAAHFEDGSSATADLIVGADGLWSRVRASIWGEEPPRYSGEYCFRGLAYGVDTDVGYLRELQGKGRRFGLAPLGEELTYWWATWRTGRDFSLDRDEYASFLSERFAGWPLRIPQFIAETRPEDIHLDALYDRRPRDAWSRGAVTLLGDAAHPTTPNLGQGGCMAIEDAGMLAELLVRRETLDEALDAYERLRIPRTSKLVNDSWRFGKIGQWRNPAAVWLRKTAARLAPASVMRAQLVDKIGYDAMAAARGL